MVDDYLIGALMKRPSLLMRIDGFLWI